jgi:hypothetical protein
LFTSPDSGQIHSRGTSGPPGPHQNHPHWLVRAVLPKTPTSSPHSHLNVEMVEEKDDQILLCSKCFRDHRPPALNFMSIAWDKGPFLCSFCPLHTILLSLASIPIIPPLCSLQIKFTEKEKQPPALPDKYHLRKYKENVALRGCSAERHSLDKV